MQNMATTSMTAKERACLIADVAISMFVFTPLSVMLWRSVWHLQDSYILPHDDGSSGIVSGLAGTAGLLLFNLFQYRIQPFCDSLARPWRLLFLRVYIHGFALATISQWRGLWTVIDAYCGETALSGWLSLLAGVGILCSLRCFRSSVGPPLVVEPDFSPQLCKIPTRFRMKRSDSYYWFLDCCVSVFMEGGFTIIAWRGQWELLNVYLAPNRIYTSLWAGYGIGVAICLLAFALQPVVAGMSRRLDEQHVAYKTVLETVFIGIANFGAINMWRALWHAYNVYIWPPEDVDIYHYTQKSCWLTLGVASVLMMALANLKGAITSGVDIDGSYMNGDGCWFHVHYTSDVISQIRGGAFTKKRTGPKGKGIRRLLRNTLYSENGPMHFLAAIAAQINVGGLPTTGDNAADSVNGFPSTGSLPRLTVDPLPMEEDNPAFEANSEGVASPGEQETRPRFSLIVAEPNRRASIFMPDSGDNDDDDDDDDEPEFGVVPVDSRKGSYLEVVTRNSLPDRNGSIYEIRQTTDRRRSMFETQQAAQKTTRAGSPTKKDAPPKKDTPL